VVKVLFLCIGNSIRSQMAEAFARKYGSDVIDAASAGFSPAPIVQPFTRKVMDEKNISLENHFPKDLEHVPLTGFDLIINISGRKLPTKLPMPVREWEVGDPMSKSEDEYRKVRDQIENLVMSLILDIRRFNRAPRPAAARPPALRPQRTP
jgi:arsenate reductase